MGAIQNQINQALAQTAITGGIVKHAKVEEKQAKLAEEKTKAEIASTQEQLNATKLAYKNDTIEAAKAIGAHESSFGDIDFNGKKIKDITSEEYAGLDDAKIKELAGIVDNFREGKLKDDRIKKLEDASNLKETGSHTVKRAQTIPGERLWRQSINVKTGQVVDLYRDTPSKHVPGKYISNKEYKNQQLEKAYDSFRELNDRIAASRKLKFNIKAAEEKIRKLQEGGNK